MMLTSISTKTAKRDGATNERTVFTLGEHYTVYRLVTRYPSGYTFKNFRVSVETIDQMDNFIPDIYYDDDFENDGKDAQFKVQTTAYGALDINAIELVTKGYEEAIEAVKILNKNFTRHIDR